MAGGDSNLNLRMSSGDQNPEDQNPEGQFYYESIFRLFKESKVEIASAITDPFPIFMSLRDHGFISEQSYQYFIEACRNLVPVERVMYNVLSEMEKTFDKRIPKALFSKVNMKAYPALHEIYRNFQNVIPENFNYPITYDEERNYSLNSQLSCEQGDTQPRERIPEHLSDGRQMNTREEESSHDSKSTVETQEMTNECAQESEQAEDSKACCEPGDGEEPQEVSSSSLGSGAVSCELVDLERDERGTSEEMPTLLPYDGEMTCDSEALQINNEGVLKKAISLTASEGEENSNAFWEPCDGEETQEALYSSPRLEPVLCDPETPQMITEKERDEVASPALCDREVSVGIEALQRDREGESEELPSSLLPCDGQETVDLGNNSTLGKPKRKRESRKLTDESVDFHSQILPVTCGAIKGMLYQNKLKQGSTVKCIQGEDGSWFTPQEFGVKGVCSGWNYWKDAVHCGGRRLRWLIEKGFLPNPPRIYSKGKKQRLPNSHDNTSIDLCPRNSDVCEVCHNGRKLFCCDTCSRSFHKNCHLPPVKSERDLWSCIFCRIKAYSASQKCHRESEVLTRQMGPEEQLKCEFLLVKVYCHSESSFFKNVPYYYYIKEASQKLKEPMYLDKIKRKLNKQSYPQVEGFVRDMRLIFQNHRASKKYADFGQMGLRLEAEFENNFKEVFAIQETNENSFVV